MQKLDFSSRMIVANPGYLAPIQTFGPDHEVIQIARTAEEARGVTNIECFLGEALVALFMVVRAWTTDQHNLMNEFLSVPLSVFKDTFPSHINLFWLRLTVFCQF